MLESTALYMVSSSYAAGPIGQSLVNLVIIVKTLCILSNSILHLRLNYDCLEGNFGIFWCERQSELRGNFHKGFY